MDHGPAAAHLTLPGDLSTQLTAAGSWSCVVASFAPVVSSRFFLSSDTASARNGKEQDGAGTMRPQCRLFFLSLPVPIF